MIVTWGGGGWWGLSAGSFSEQQLVIKSKSLMTICQSALPYSILWGDWWLASLSSKNVGCLWASQFLKTHFYVRASLRSVKMWSCAKFYLLIYDGWLEKGHEFTLWSWIYRSRSKWIRSIITSYPRQHFQLWLKLHTSYLPWLLLVISFIKSR